MPRAMQLARVTLIRERGAVMPQQHMLSVIDASDAIAAAMLTPRR